MTSSKIRELGLLAVTAALAIGWGIDHARLTQRNDLDSELAVLKERARTMPIQDKWTEPQSDSLLNTSESVKRYPQLGTPDQPQPQRLDIGPSHF